MKLRNLEDLFIQELRDVYDAERQLVRALKRLAKAASSEELRSAFEEHLGQTEGQIGRLEQVFGLFDHKVKGKSCEAMKGLIEEGKDVIDAIDDDSTGDAALIAAAQKAEHYEIATYGCLETWARRLGRDDAARLLKETLEEEKATDRKLTELAERRFNPEAEHGRAQVVGTRQEEAQAGNGRHEEEGHAGDGRHEEEEQHEEMAGAGSSAPM